MSQSVKEQAEKIAAQISLNLKSFYEKWVQIQDDYVKLNNAIKVPYEEIFKADSMGATNEFNGLIIELSMILDLGLHKKEDRGLYNSELYEGSLKILEGHYEHICK